MDHKEKIKKNALQHGIAKIAGQGGSFAFAAPLGLLSRWIILKPAPLHYIYLRTVVVHFNPCPDKFL
jgi:hypothetical protein